MRRRLWWLALALLVGGYAVVACTGYGSADRRTDRRPVDCHSGMVTLKVVSNHHADIRITLPGRTLRPAARGLGVTTYRVARSRLTGGGALHLEIARGGLQVGAPAPVPLVGHIECDVATLVIGAAIRQAILFGADVR